MIAGSFAGLAEHVATFPLDTAKTMSQTIQAGEERPKVAVLRTLREFGFMRFFRGVQSAFVGCVPAHAAYFSIYEHIKQWGQSRGWDWCATAGGVLGTMAHDGIMTPMDVCKQRLQLGYYTGLSDCIRSILRTEGVGALYKSFPTTIVMNIPYAAVMVSTNEFSRKRLSSICSTDTTLFLTSGMIAGAVAAVVTTPLDVAKTRLQTQGRGLGLQWQAGQQATGATVKYTGLLHTLRLISQQEGLKALNRGMVARVMVHAPSVAISWSSYEWMKRLLSK